MSHETSSGNRWEPAPPRSGQEPAASTDAAGPTDGPGVAPSATAPGSASRPRSRRDKSVLAGLAAVLLLGGGASGYTLWHVTGAAADDAHPGQHQNPPPGPGGPGTDDRGRDDHGAET